MMRRTAGITVLLILGLLVWPFAAEAEQPAKGYRHRGPGQV